VGAKEERDPLPTEWLSQLVKVVEQKAYLSKELGAVEALVLVFLTLLFGFRPVTVVKMELSSMTISEEGLSLTEAFRKGYSAKTTPKRRMLFPWSNFREVKDLL
jgi:hypothetical protein